MACIEKKTAIKFLSGLALICGLISVVLMICFYTSNIRSVDPDWVIGCFCATGTFSLVFAGISGVLWFRKD